MEAKELCFACHHPTSPSLYRGSWLTVTRDCAARFQTETPPAPAKLGILRTEPTTAAQILSRHCTGPAWELRNPVFWRDTYHTFRPRFLFYASSTKPIKLARDADGEELHPQRARRSKTVLEDLQLEISHPGSEFNLQAFTPTRNTNKIHIFRVKAAMFSKPNKCPSYSLSSRQRPSERIQRLRLTL